MVFFFFFPSIQKEKRCLEKMFETKGQKQEPKVKGQNGN
jgi:hypothetical protein